MKRFKNSIILVFVLSLIINTFSFTPALAAADLSGWGVTKAGGVDADVTIDRDVTYRGDGALKIVNRSAYGANVYVEVNTSINAEKGKTYKYSFMAKSDNAKNVSTMIDWNYATKVSLSQFGSTYGWKKFELNYVHTGESQPIVLKFLIEDLGTFRIDDFECYEYEGRERVSDNLITNSTFDSYDTSNPNYRPYDKTNEKAAEAVSKLSEFSADELEQYMGAFSVVPTVRKTDVNIDGDGGEWADITASKLPVSRSQYVMFNDNNGYDMTSETKYAYDDKSFYIYAEVEDDIHNPLPDESYWNGDCIQLALSDGEDSYGTEIGIAYYPEENETAAYSSFFFDSAGVKVNNVAKIEDDRIKAAAVRDDAEKKTYYEIAVAWDFVFETMPDEVLFSIVFSDNDGDGREYSLELTPGITSGKTNKSFKKLRFIDGSYFWINGDRSIPVNTDAPFCLYLINKGEKDTFTLTYGGKTETVTVEKGMGIMRDFTVKVDAMEEYDFDVSVASSKDTVKEVFTVKGAASEEGVTAYIEKLNGYLTELKGLMNKCKDRGIPTEYETTAYTVIERWATQYLKEDIDNNFYKATEYKATALDSIYAEARDNLKDYLAGRKTAFNVPRYVTSDKAMEINGFTVLADTVDSYGNEERRPVHFLGYGHFEEARADIPNFQNFGVNNIQNEIGPNSIISSAPAWYVDFLGDSEGEAGIIEGESSSGSRCVKATNRTPLKANAYFNLEQGIASVKPNTSYILKVHIKAEDAKGLQASWDGGRHRFNIDSGTYDWKEYAFEFKTGEKTTSADVWFICEDETKAVYFDDISLCEEGSDVNLIENGDFEGGYRNDKDEYWIYPEGAKWVVEMLKEAEENNIAVSLLIAPHYFPGLMYSLYPDLRVKDEVGAGSWSQYIPHHEKVLQVLSDYLEALLPQIKDFKSLNNICLTNEPGFRPSEYGDFYVGDWVEYLKKKYNNSLAELNAAHNANYTAWEDAKMSSTLGAGGSNESVCVYDTLEFAGDMYTEWHQFLADTVKKYIPDIPVHSKAQGTLGLHGGFPINLGNAASFEKFYTFSDLAGCDYSIEWMGLNNGAHQPLGEELWYDFLAGIGEVPVINSEDHVSVDGEENFHDQQALWVETNMWQGALHHRGFSETWVWRRNYNTANIYYGSILFRPDCIKGIGDASLDLNRLSYEVQALVEEPEDVAIFYSRSARQFNPEFMRSVYNAYEASLFNGKKVRIVTQDMIEKINKCKVLILPNCRSVPEKVLQTIYDFALNGGKIIMLGEDTLTRNDINKPQTSDLPAKIKELSWVIPTVSNGADIVSPNQVELADMFEGYFNDNNLRRVALVDAETGKRVLNTEWTSAEYNGKTLVNICNFTFDTPKRVKLVIDGKTVNSSVNLRTGENFGAVFTVNPCTPILLSVGTDHPFEDVKEHWAESSIASLYEKDMVNGTSFDTFSPDENITRAEFIKMAVRVSGLEEKRYDGSISDVSGNDWYADYVETANRAGLLEGLLSDGKLEPEKKITREEMCAVLVRTYELEKEVTAEKLKFADKNDISEQYAECAAKAVSAGLVNGNDKNEFLPKSFLTRAEAAAVIDRFILK